MKAFYHSFDTDLGTCGLAWTDGGLARVQLPDRDIAATEKRLASGGRMRWAGPLPGPVADAVNLLTQYAAGSEVDFSDIGLDDRAVPVFELAVYTALRRVPRGQTVTYGELAALAGSPGAAQAVGTAMARNPWPVVVPCHRVLAAGNKPGGFSAPGGLKTKYKLLAMEGVHLDGGTPLLPGLFDHL
jgi:methylated-DNA-[protein]-cysteine S-methyltransferase